MKGRFTRWLLVFVAVTVLTGPGRAATHLGSVYLESIDELQRQLALGANLYQAPMLQTLPQLMLPQLPGHLATDKSKPIALHFMDNGDASPGILLELSPAGSAEKYLQALVGEGMPVPAPVNGIYALKDGTYARVVGKRLLLAFGAMAEAHELIQAQAAGRSAMPDIPGVIRFSMAPSALMPRLSEVRQTFANLPSDMQNSDELSRAMIDSFDFYMDVFSQIEAFQIGAAVQAEGLYIRSRLVPRKGTEMAALFASMEPAQADALAFLEQDALLSYAVGKYVLPEALKKALVKQQTIWMTLVETNTSHSADKLAASMKSWEESQGMPQAMSCQQTADGKRLLVKGMLKAPNGTAYLKRHLESVQTTGADLFTGLVFKAPVKRTFNGVAIETYKVALDEDKAKKSLLEFAPQSLQSEALEDSVQQKFEMVRLILQLLGDEFAFAETADAVMYGMGSPAMIEQAISLQQAPADNTATADRLRKVLAPGAALYSLGRLSLGELMKCVLINMPDEELTLSSEMMPALPNSGGALFGSWMQNQEIHGAFLLPPSEVEAIKVLLPVFQMNLN